MPETILFEDLISKPALMKWLDVPAGTVDAWVCRKQIPHVRLGGRSVRFSRKAVQAWINSRVVVAD